MLALVIAAPWVSLAAKKPGKARARPARPPAAATSPSAAAAAPRVPAPPTWSPEELARLTEVRELTVVGVYRPVEMAGRVVSVPREVYLQPVDGREDRLKELLGRTLEVIRRVPVPAAVTAPRSPTATARGPGAPPRALASEPVSAAPAPATAAPAPPSSALGAVQRLRALRKAAQAPAPPPTLPPSAAPVPVSVAPASEPAAPPESVTGVRRPAPRPLAALAMEVSIGRVQVVEVRGPIAVARVADDGVGKPAGLDAASVPAELPAVMAGDLARFTILPPPPPVPPPPAAPPPLTRAERARLDLEKRKAEAENWRRKHRRGKYERESMKWKL